MKRLIPVLVLVAAVIVGLVITTRGDEPAAEPPAVPTLTIARLDGTGDFALADLAGADTPTLLWFWAPWCPICASEAPHIERLAQQQSLRVIAIGGRDRATNGPAFVADHGLTTPTILFDEAMTVWNHYAIPAQPGAVLLDREGRERRRWLGPFDPDEALAAAQAL